MLEIIVRRNTCRLCDGPDLQTVLKLPATPVGDSYLPHDRLDLIQETFPLDLCLCRSCGHAQLLNVVDPNILYREYIYATSRSPGLPEHFQGYVDEVVRKVNGPEGALVVDIGSNDGTLLRCFQKRGMWVLGVDPACEIARQATESGIETLPHFFTPELAQEIRRARGPAAIITANNVMANIDDLGAFGRGIRCLLAPDGIFVFETGYGLDLCRKSLLDNIYHEHLSYFSVKPLVAFFQRNGMNLLDVEHLGSKGGSIRGIVQLADGPRTVSSSVAAQIAVETAAGFDKAETFEAFGARMGSLKKELTGLLRNLKAQGKTIAGYGASVGVTTLNYYFELSDLLSFLVDDNPSRQALFSPGHHLPVLSPEVLYTRTPDYVLVLAWRYAEPIIKKNRMFLAQGGHFVVPLPRIEVIPESRL